MSIGLLETRAWDSPRVVKTCIAGLDQSTRHALIASAKTKMHGTFSTAQMLAGLHFSVPRLLATWLDQSHTDPILARILPTYILGQGKMHLSEFDRFSQIITNFSTDRSLSVGTTSCWAKSLLLFDQSNFPTSSAHRQC
ncbi:LOW QUALITY PROTEIN: hypothetical protein ACHAW6_010028 [Cyclotella cf. meneghiniana]